MCLFRGIPWLILFQTNECEFFVYGGCGSNGNIFRTEDDCSKACMDNSEYDNSEEDTSEEEKEEEEEGHSDI